MKIIFQLLLLPLLLLFSLTSSGQEDPLDKVKWEFSVEQNDCEATIIAKASIVKHWHLYAAHLPEGSFTLPTELVLDESPNYKIKGKLLEPKPEISHDDILDEDLFLHSGVVLFKQKITIIAGQDFTLKGRYSFQTCDETHCLPPYDGYFSLKIKGCSSASTEQGIDSTKTDTIPILEEKIITQKLEISDIIPTLPLLDLENPIGNCGEKKSVSNVWLVFLFGFIGGLIALLTPCVFPMIPLTVSFFTKGDDKSSGLGQALLYGFFIFLIYALLSVPFHFNADPAVLSEIATSVWLNVLFFIVFLIFAISFFGYFEITLPSSISNKADSASDIGGIIGVFFMALTLALVSFSCTGPILGTVLGSALKNGAWPISAAMGGFGIALGLPFAIFAAFPSFLNKLPKSGGWLNSVKVVLGFIELALALKFLSNADLVEQWGLIKRETFFLIWTLIGIGLSLYLIGWINFPHSSPIGKFSKFRIVFTSIIIAFTIYIAPGILKNSPWNHNLLSGFPPPSFYSWYDNEAFHSEFTDFDLAMEEAIKQNKPLLIDFTGWACVNCRKMEETVWSSKLIKEKLKEEFILVSLYVDDKVELPSEKQGVFEFQKNGVKQEKKIKTIGNKWSTFQTHVFNNNSQPYYAMISPDGYLLGNPIGYTPDVIEYKNYLECGLKAFRASNP
ncbi:MAG: thioredoxin family protein [Vicingus serpentipes]|nr:thioredoxin family protein [Vicingus serpentipes]